MKIYAFIDARHPELNLVLLSTEDPDLTLERIEVDVEDGESVVDAVKQKLSG